MTPKERLWLYGAALSVLGILTAMPSEGRSDAFGWVLWFAVAGIMVAGFARAMRDEFARIRWEERDGYKDRILWEERNDRWSQR